MTKMSRQSVHVRLPATLLDEIHDRADAEGISVNTLIATLLAGSMQFNLKAKKRPKPAKPNRGVCPPELDARTQP
jgi:hypothetical protein